MRLPLQKRPHTINHIVAKGFIEPGSNNLFKPCTDPATQHPLKVAVALPLTA